MRAAADGYVLPNPGMGARLNWDGVADFLDAPELKDEKFSDASARLTNAEELGEVLDRIFQKKNKFDVFYAAHKQRFIYGVVLSPEEVLANDQYRERGYWVDMDHPKMGSLKFPGAPFLMSDSPWQVRRPAPSLGQHNRELFGEQLGRSDSDLAGLRALGVI